MKDLYGRTVLRRTYEAVQASQLFDEVFVVCDHEDLSREVASFEGQFIMSIAEHESGSDRIAEAAKKLDADIIVNIQGDEPFISKEALQQVIRLFDRPEVEVGTLYLRIDDPEKIANPSCVKVVMDQQGRALYFSRAAIPFSRDHGLPLQAFQHVGVYAFRKETLLRFASLPVSGLEQIEKLENLRLLENGIPVHLAPVEHVGLSIDTQEDYEKALILLSDRSSG